MNLIYLYLKCIFYLFYEVKKTACYLCDMLSNVSVNFNWVHPPGQPPGISSKNFPRGRDLTLKVARGRESDKGRDFVENEIETSKNSVD